MNDWLFLFTCADEVKASVAAALGRANLATYLAVTQLWQLLPHGQPLLLLIGPKHRAASVQGECVWHCCCCCCCYRANLAACSMRQCNSYAGPACRQRRMLVHCRCVAAPLKQTSAWQWVILRFCSLHKHGALVEQQHTACPGLTMQLMRRQSAITVQVSGMLPPAFLSALRCRVLCLQMCFLLLPTSSCTLR
jgi:hypothetical protein